MYDMEDILLVVLLKITETHLFCSTLYLISLRYVCERNYLSLYDKFQDKYCISAFCWNMMSFPDNKQFSLSFQGKLKFSFKNILYREVANKMKYSHVNSWAHYDLDGHLGNIHCCCLTSKSFYSSIRLCCILKELSLTVRQ